ncbi:sortase [Oscillibacter sp.]|uniref:sortase n=1 Tax=Oscillibacter sp. TaxID=1945593 RepID=UPI00258A8E7A|nr:sortase [Oscillibacter sp.]
MMLKRRLLMLCQMACIAVLAVCLFRLSQPWRAALTASKTLTELKAQIQAGNVNSVASDMPTVEIDGYDYIGYLSIPEIDRELPVMADLTDEKLKISPCRYYGSIAAENMVLGAHNYPGFFGHLKELSPGAELVFTGVDGQVWQFVVAESYVLPPSAVREMISGEYPLTLFTCTEDDKDRLTVRFEALPKADSQEGRDAL